MQCYHIRFHIAYSRGLKGMVSLAICYLSSMPRLKLKTDVELHYKLRGDKLGNGETLVFVNGLTMDTSSWKPLELHFDDYQTLRYDCRGQGKSDKPPGPYTPEQHSDDLLALLEGLELSEVHLIGLSNGGLISMLTAGRLASTERIKSVVTIDSLLSVDPILKTTLLSWKAALVSGGPGLRFDVATPWVWGYRFLNAHVEDVLGFRDLAASADAAAIASLIDGAAGFESAREVWSHYKGPSLAIVGEDDLLTPPRYSKEIVECAFNGRLEYLPEAGHAAPIERPGAVAGLIKAFLNSLGAG